MFWIYLFSCGEKTIDTIAIDTAVVEPSTEPAGEPSVETGTDQDGDGFTVENGDCDDNDPWTNPARDEENNDNIDNDCDGRTDEKWSGVTVSLRNSGRASSLVVFNQIGNVEDQITLNNDCVPTYLDSFQQKITNSTFTDTGWVISHANSALATVSATGDCSVIADFSEEEENTELLGVIAHPDGYYLASRGNALVKISNDGTVDTLAEWDANIVDDAGEANPAYQIYVWSIARDIRTDTIALFGLFGGFATWDATNGFVQHRQVDANTWDGRYAYAGAYKDGGGWYTLLYNSDNGEISVARFNATEANWVNRVVWTDQDHGAQEFAFPQGITVNGDMGDYYITADVASFSMVYRIREADQFIDDFYFSGAQYDWTFMGIVSNY